MSQITSIVIIMIVLVVATTISRIVILVIMARMIIMCVQSTTIPAPTPVIITITTVTIIYISKLNINKYSTCIISAPPLMCLYLYSGLSYWSDESSPSYLYNQYTCIIGLRNIKSIDRSIHPSITSHPFHIHAQVDAHIYTYRHIYILSPPSLSK